MKRKLFKSMLVLIAAISVNVASAQIVNIKMVENGGSGPYKAIITSDQSFPDYAIYRPADMKAAVDAEGKLPIIVYGNGGCRAISVEFEKFLTEIASHGYVIAAIGPLSHMNLLQSWQAQIPSSDASMLNRAMDWWVEQANRPGSEYYNMIDTDKIAAMGQSCGGLQALTASTDPRVKTSVILNSGIFKIVMPDFSQINVDSLVNTLPEDTQARIKKAGNTKEELEKAFMQVTSESAGIGGTMNKAGLQKLHAPLVYIIGGPDDIAYENAEDDYQEINHLPIAVANLPVGHSGTYQADYGGQFSIVALKWLDWQFKRRDDESTFFLNEEYVKKYFPEWNVKHKNFK